MSKNNTKAQKQVAIRVREAVQELNQALLRAKENDLTVVAYKVSQSNLVVDEYTALWVEQIYSRQEF